MAISRLACRTNFRSMSFFYNSSQFDQAGIGYPGPPDMGHSRGRCAEALDSLKLKDASGRGIYPLELPADFDFWNLLCAQAGHPALDLGVWHLADPETEGLRRMRALDFIHEIFPGTGASRPPLPKAGEPPGRLFIQQRASLLMPRLLIVAAVMSSFQYSFTLLPRDMAQASLAQVNGWAVPGKIVARRRRCCARWRPTSPPSRYTRDAELRSKKVAEDVPRPSAAFATRRSGQAVIPRLEPKTEKMAQFLDQQINLLARNSQMKTDALYTKIQAEYQNRLGIPPVFDPSPKPAPKVNAGGLREPEL